MINIASFKVLKGYEHWKTVLMDEAFVKSREQAGVKFWLEDLMHLGLNFFFIIFLKNINFFYYKTY